MLLIFGYMDVMIIMKWLTFYPDTNCAPSLITQLLNIPLSKLTFNLFYHNF